MVVEYAFLDAQSFSAGIVSWKGHKQNLCTVLAEIDVLGVLRPRPLASVGKFWKIWFCWYTSWWLSTPMFFGARNRFSMSFLPQNVHGMSYGHAHIRPWEIFEKIMYVRIHHDWYVHLCFLTPEIDCQCLFYSKMFMGWVMATPIYDRGKFWIS